MPALIAVEHNPEKPKGFVQFVYLGLNVAAEDDLKFVGSDEGVPIRIQFEDLEAKLCDPEEKWVPSGRMHVLAWLAMGAPTYGCPGSFNDAEARRIFKSWERSAVGNGGSENA
jgi:hypothetical protein